MSKKILAAIIGSCVGIIVIDHVIDRMNNTIMDAVDSINTTYLKGVWANNTMLMTSKVIDKTVDSLEKELGDIDYDKMTEKQKEIYDQALEGFEEYLKDICESCPW